MDARDLRDRIWFGLCETQRKAYYYSDLFQRLASIYRAINFFSIVIPPISVILLQTEANIPEWWVPVLLLLVAVGQTYALHFNLAGDAASARVMANQLGKLTQKWRLLWIYQDEEGLEKWVDHLEDLTEHVTFEHLSTYREKLHLRTQQEAYDELETQFGFETETSDINTH